VPSGVKGGRARQRCTLDSVSRALPESTEQPVARVGYRRALASREFRALLGDQSVSIAGTSVAAVALTVLVYRRTGSLFLSAL